MKQEAVQRAKEGVSGKRISFLAACRALLPKGGHPSVPFRVGARRSPPSPFPPTTPLTRVIEHRPERPYHAAVVAVPPLSAASEISNVQRPSLRHC